MHMHIHMSRWTWTWQRSVAPGIVELPLVKACSEEISRARQKTCEQVSELTKTRAI